jgi:hypothetical protein
LSEHAERRRKQSKSGGFDDGSAGRLHLMLLNTISSDYVAFFTAAAIRHHDNPA